MFAAFFFFFFKPRMVLYVIIQLLEQSLDGHRFEEYLFKKIKVIYALVFFLRSINTKSNYS